MGILSSLRITEFGFSKKFPFSHFSALLIREICRQPFKYIDYDVFIFMQSTLTLESWRVRTKMSDIENIFHGELTPEIRCNADDVVI